MLLLEQIQGVQLLAQMLVGLFQLQIFLKVIAIVPLKGIVSYLEMSFQLQPFFSDLKKYLDCNEWNCKYQQCASQNVSDLCGGTTENA